MLGYLFAPLVASCETHGIIPSVEIFFYTDPALQLEEFNPRTKKKMM